MTVDPNQIRALVEQPVEALQVELKTWLDPRTDDGISKIVKAIFAIRNRNGGFLLIGFDNATRKSDPYAFDQPVETLFHIDILQGLVSRYVSPSFEIEVAFVDRDGQSHPVISIPEGVQVPAVVRRDLIGQGGKKLLTEGDLYFRTFNSNGTASSARILPPDYADLLDVCFENREADIGRFLRRHLAGVGPAATLSAALGIESEESKLRKRAFDLLESGSTGASNAIAERATAEQLSRIGNALTMHVGLALDPAHPDALPTQEFLNKVSSSNPNYTGWPVWLDSRGFMEKLDRPYVNSNMWETLIIDLDGGWSEHVEFLRFDPRGEFYLQRVMQDDLTEKVAPGTALDVILMIYRVAEVLAVGTILGRSLGWGAQSVAGFAFRWTGLKNRALRPWVNAFRSTGGSGSISRSSGAEAYVAVPLETPGAALAPYVSTALAPLFSLFEGYQPSAELIETSVRKLIERKLDN
ncbi:helix-turn-helix domain-containing protein [Sphingobium bisphenolivorans]|uniref:AlbA family DNA-binding domain-containing protein n=1 Tax=Sphingobium bisphenolivorans TaxID=1335760 RepID=UPI0003A37862|nr:RNA-binding domain-containing protein [Sphingobium bisphenolivorans]